MPENVRRAAPSVDRLRADVAEVLAEPGETLGDEENLLDRGLDSIRMMTLVERWGRDGIETSFLELADDPTLVGWHALFETKIDGRTA